MRRRRGSSEAQDFDLLIWKTAEGRFRARVLYFEGGGEALWDFDAPFSKELHGALPETAGGCRDLKPSQAPSLDTAWDRGTRLFEAVFGGNILVFWKRHLLKAQEEGRVLRLRLRLDAPELWDWPWELLCDPAQGFLAVNPATPVVRYVEMAAPIPPLRVRPPLRVLAVTASPSGLSPVGIEEELKDLEKSLAELQKPEWVELETLRGTTRETLRRTLLEGNFHVLHFIGHGAFDVSLEQGVIFLEKEDGSRDPVDGLELNVLLLAQPRLRLAVLNACNGARGSRSDPFASLAQSLVRARLPAVIAMQSVVTDRAAITFARHFYESLSQRNPVDRAVTDARHAMFFLGSGEWGSPVLALRAPDGRIIAPPRWEILINDLAKFLEPWRQALVVLLLLFLLVFGGWGLARRWFDLNLLYTFRNPSECPSPPGLPIAFVKIEPSGERPFCISRFEVTQRLWRKIMGKVPTRRWGNALPVVRVSWNDAVRFLTRLKKREPGAGFRLPTGAEWLYAAQSGEENPGVSSSAVANCDNKEETDGYEGLAPIGSFPRNAWSLYDMAGNVSEWVDEWDKSRTKRVRRGASFDNALVNCSVAYSSDSKPDSRYDDTGFRVVRETIDPSSRPHAPTDRATGSRGGVTRPPKGTMTVKTRKARTAFLPNGRFGDARSRIP